MGKTMICGGLACAACAVFAWRPSRGDAVPKSIEKMFTSDFWRGTQYYDIVDIEAVNVE